MLTPLHALWTVLVALVVLFLPGLTWLAWASRDEKDPAALVADALGISVAITAIIALLTFLLKLRVNAGWALVFYGLLALLAAGGFAFRAYLERLQSPWKTWQRERRLDRGALALVLTGAAVLAWRFFQARGLAFPAWVDSIHHTLIVRAMLENGRLPETLAPLIDVPLYYHIGFHSIAAAFAGVARLAPDQAVLWIGQALNAGVCLSAYRLARTAWKDDSRLAARAGAAAALLMAFFSQMPAYYLTWGRYTLLTGLVVLPVAMSAALELFERPRRETAARLALLTAGLLLAHYLAAFLMALFLVLLGLAKLWRELRQKRIEWRGWALRIGMPLAGLALAAPWLTRIGQYAPENWRVTPYLTEEAFSRLVTPGGINYLVYMLGPRHNYFLLGLGALALLAALFHPRGRVICAWGLALLVLCLPFGFRLGPFRPDHYAIVLFLPACLLSGWLLARAAAALERVLPKRRRAGWLMWLALALWCAWGARETQNVVNPVTVIATRADRAALNWIAAYTPPDARFYINTILWQGVTYRGVDGGAWITTDTGRFALVPAVVYEWGTPAYREQIKRWAEAASTARGCTPEFWSVAREAGITHIYLRIDKGPARAADFSNCPGVEPVYDLNGVTILRITSLP